MQAAHFGGPGAGIALSSIMVFLIGLGFHGGPESWRADWIGGALYCAASLVIVFLLLPSAPAQSARTGKEPALVWSRPMVLITLSYGLFGFGYVITATFLVTIARLSATGAFVEFLCWFIAGLTSAVALFAWKPLVRPLGLGGVYVAALLVEAAGVLATVMAQARQWFQSIVDDTDSPRNVTNRAHMMLDLITASGKAPAAQG